MWNTLDGDAAARTHMRTTRAVVRGTAVDGGFLRSLVGYNARRAGVSILGLFKERMQVFDLQPIDFSVLSLIRHNPGITSRAICDELNLMAPNLVRLMARLDERALVQRRPHPTDGRAWGLSLTPEGERLMSQAEPAAAQLEVDATADLNDEERAQLIRLLQRIYL
jgi:DNA-binding MarR family transcriptional regulator